MAKCFAYLLLVLIISGCGSRKIEPTKKFLVRQWYIDTLYGSKDYNDYAAQRIYFTPENKFWRFSSYTKSYILDSALIYENHQIFDKGKLKYTVQAIDSNTIHLTTTDNKVYKCSKGNLYDSQDIETVLESNPIKQMIHGDWELIDSEFIPAYIPSTCRKLYLGSTFTFTTDGFFRVFPKDSLKKCSSHGYSIYKKELNTQEYDMIVSFDILELTKEKLVLKSTHFSHDYEEWVPENEKARSKGFYNLTLKRKNKK